MIMQARVVKTYRSSFEREIGESIWINRALKEGVNLLNSKNEYNLIKKKFKKKKSSN